MVIPGQVPVEPPSGTGEPPVGAREPPLSGGEPPLGIQGLDTAGLPWTPLSPLDTCDPPSGEARKLGRIYVVNVIYDNYCTKG
jgi:hypothetical protein